MAVATMNLSTNLTSQNIGDYGWSYLQSYWPTYPSTVYVSTYPNRFEQAFKVVSKLIENGTIKEIKLKDFIKLVKEVEEIL